MIRRKTTLLLFLLLSLAIGASAQTDSLRHEILLETDSGNVRIALYNETPLHRDNFIKRVKAGDYDGVLFHRVIRDFMVQSGDMGSKNAPQGKLLGDTPESYSVPAEIRFPQFFHKRGAVAAAREGDSTNPERRSSASQFYIVWGVQWNDEGLDKVQKRIDEYTHGTMKLTPEIREVYKTLGGTPHLDGSYTVFGEVTEGLEVIARIENAATDDHDRPLKDIHVIRATVVK